MMTNTDEFVSSLEAARILERAPDTVRQLARSGRLPIAIETSAGRLFRRADVVALAAKRRAQSGNEVA